MSNYFNRIGNLFPKDSTNVHIHPAITQQLVDVRKELEVYITFQQSFEDADVFEGAERRGRSKWDSLGTCLRMLTYDSGRRGELWQKTFDDRCLVKHVTNMLVKLVQLIYKHQNTAFSNGHWIDAAHRASTTLTELISTEHLSVCQIL